MKVLKKGRKQKGWATVTKCTGEGNRDGGCGALLLVEEGDLFRTQSNAMGEITDYITFECPDCGVWTDLNQGKVPGHILGERLPFRAPLSR